MTKSDRGVEGTSEDGDTQMRHMTGDVAYGHQIDKWEYKDRHRLAHAMQQDCQRQFSL